VTLHLTPHQLRADQAVVIAKLRNAYHAGTTRSRLNITALSSDPKAGMVVK
jgi:hypothetical protein